MRQDEEEVADIDDIPKECPHKKQKNGKLVGKALKEPCQEACSKESEVLKVARWAFYKAHQPNFKQEGSYDLSSNFWQLATSTNLLDTEVQEVQESWGS